MLISIILILISIGIYASFHTTSAGKTGEFFIDMFTFFGLNGKEYKTLSNITLKTNYGGTSQIDTVIFSKYGIFVIEVKNYKGLIFGSQEGKKWLQIVGRNKYPFYNPVMQNRGHIKVLSNTLGISRGFHSIVVFVGTAQLKTKRINGVIKKDHFLRYIKNFKNEIFTDDEVSFFYNTIKNKQLEKSINTDRLHIENTKRISELLQTI